MFVAKLINFALLDGTPEIEHSFTKCPKIRLVIYSRNCHPQIFFVFFSQSDSSD